MDQLLTTLWRIGGWFCAFTPPPAVDHAPQGTPILNVPSDILLLIGDCLNDGDILSLKLTCRSTYVLFPQTYKKLPTLLKKRFLPIIERDPLGRGFVYCYPCNKLHPYLQTTGPHLLAKPDVDGKRLKCLTRDQFSPTGNPFALSYMHARLVMNRHIYGPEYGIPLSNLCTEQNERRGPMMVRCLTSAKIMDDELFIQRTYIFTLAESAVTEFRRCTGARDFKLCEHTSLLPSASPFRQYITELLKKPTSGGNGLVPCREAPGSCGLCLMDYDITINPCVDRFHRIVIRVTHRLGSCRSPRDWKWARFSEAHRIHVFYPVRPNRRGSPYAPGCLHKQWADDEKRAYAMLEGGSMNLIRKLLKLPLLG